MVPDAQNPTDTGRVSRGGPGELRLPGLKRAGMAETRVVGPRGNQKRGTGLG